MSAQLVARLVSQTQGDASSPDQELPTILLLLLLCQGSQAGAHGTVEFLTASQCLYSLREFSEGVRCEVWICLGKGGVTRIVI